MPKNYSNTVIYKLVCKDPNVKHCFVDSTTNFASKKHFHKSNVQNVGYKNYGLYKIIRDNGGWENWQMEIIEKCPFESEIEVSNKVLRYLMKQQDEQIVG